jgi:hypothetical protein
MQNNRIKVIITGSTGMVGEGVLHVCLNDPRVEKILLINRRKLGIEHLKIKEIVLPDLYDLTPMEEQLSGYDACFYCLGISSVGMKKDEYYKITYELTMSFGKTLSKLNPDLTFIYVSGAGTDSSEKGSQSWARVKGKTENDLMKLPFKKVIGFRPGFIKPIKGLQNTHSYYKYVSWLYPVGRLLYTDGFSTMDEVGRSMINLVYHDYSKKIITGKDIKILAGV